MKCNRKRAQPVAAVKYLIDALRAQLDVRLLGTKLVVVTASEHATVVVPPIAHPKVTRSINLQERVNTMLCVAIAGQRDGRR